MKTLANKLRIPILSDQGGDARSIGFPQARLPDIRFQLQPQAIHQVAMRVHTFSVIAFIELYSLF